MPTEAYASRLGHFSDDGTSYSITSPHTPHGWNQYLFNHEYLASVDINAHGMSFYKRPDGTRANLILDGSMPRRVYVRDQASGTVLCLPKAEGCTLTIRPGVAEFRAAGDGVEVTWTISVPDGLRGEGWRITVKNTSVQSRRLMVVGMFPLWPHGYGTNFGYEGSMGLMFHEELDAIVLTNNDPDRPDPLYNAYMMQDAKTHSFDTSTATFLAGGSLDAPGGIKSGKLSNRLNCSSGHHAGKIAALASEHEVAASAVVTVQMVLGVAADAAEVAQIRRKWFAQADTMERAVKATQEHYLRLTGRVQVKTPDAEFDRLVNHWLGYNLCFTALWTRLYSRGFRDCMQDTQGVAALDAAQARANLLEAMPHVYKSGRCRRSWAAGKGALSDQYYADQPIWVAPAFKAYLAETSDKEILDEMAPWFDSGEASVWEHLVACQRHMYEDRGAHGLCLIHEGDWCDTAHKLGVKGKGEGIWLSIAYHKSLVDFIEIADWLGKKSEAADARKWAEEMRKVINQHGWDGEWFGIAYNDEGRFIGTKKDAEAQVFLNPQSWSVIADVTTPERKAAAMEAIDERLDSWVGPHLLYPPFTKPDATIGAITAFHPGTSENGSCYCHAAAFKIVADCMAGRGAKAFETFCKIMPGGDADRRAEGATCPPFAFTNSRVAAYHPHDAGKHGGTWITGTISWCFQAASEYILGARRTLDGLKIDPCVPPSWREFSIRRVFRGAVYEIHVSNPKGVQKGVASVSVDGKPINGTLLPVLGSGTHHVEVVMG